MASSISRDHTRRTLYRRHELARRLYKSLGHDQSLEGELRYQMLQCLHALPRNSSPTRIHNRCVLTGRAHGVMRLCRVSRIRMRELVAQGLVMGVTKASW